MSNGIAPASRESTEGDRPAGTWRRRALERLRYARGAFLLAGLAALGTVLVALQGYQASQLAVAQGVRDHAGDVAALLKSQQKWMEAEWDSDEGLAALFDAWKATTSDGRGVHLMLTDAGGTVRLCSHDANHAGMELGHLEISESESDLVVRLADVAGQDHEISGVFAPIGHREQFVTLVPLHDPPGVLAIHVPVDTVREQVLAEVLPWFFGLAFVVLFLIPATVWLLNRAYRGSERSARHAEEKSREAEARFRTLFEESFEFSGLLSLDGTVLEVNRTALELGGLTADDVIGRPLWETGWFAGDETQTRRLQRGVEAAADGRSDHVEARFQTAELGPSAVDVALKPFRDRHGDVAMVLAEARDITARKRAEAARKTNELYYRALIEHAPDMVLVLDAEHMVRYASPSVERRLGYRQDQVLAHHVLEFVGPEDQRAVAKALLKAQREPGQPVTLEHQALREDGEQLVLDSHLRALPPGIEDGAFVVNARDVTDRVRLERRLREGERLEAIGRLAGGVAHDFNNLVTAVLGYSDLLLYNMRPTEGNYRLVEEIKRASERGSSLTQQLLAFGRRQIMHPVVLDLNSVVEELDEFLDRLIGEDVDVEFDLDPMLGLIRADAGQVEQVVINLAVNARDAMPQGGTLTIRTWNETVSLEGDGPHPPADVHPGEYTVLEVRDDGVGMDEPTQRKIFEPFFTTKRQNEGTGLGLATVYGIVRQSRGFLDVESSPGEGSKFRVYLPHTSEPPSTEIGLPSLRLTGVARGDETILVVEDQDSVRGLIVTVLEMNGYEVLQASDAPGALRELMRSRDRIALLLTDVVMPGMSGPALAAKVQEFAPEIRVLFVSGHTDEEIEEKGGLPVGTALLPKPFSANALAATVRDVLDEDRVPAV